MIHLVKLCVGVSSVEELEEWRAHQIALGVRAEDAPNVHRTRMMPKRRDEIIGKGSLYWVIGGAIRCRQAIVDLDPETDHEGRGLCAIHMAPEVIRTVPQPKRPFQGWRYLKAEDAPADLERCEGAGDDAGELIDDLARLGLI